MASGLYSQHLRDPKIRIIRNAVMGVVLFFFAVVVLFPLVYMLAWSFGPAQEMAATSYAIFPKTWSLDNFREAMRVTDFWHSLRNSLLISISTIVLSVLVHSLRGYALGRNKAHSKFYSFVYLFIVSGMFVPFAILMMPLAKQTAELHLANWVGVILLYVVFYMPMNIMLYSGYLVNIPIALEEAARVDGAGSLQRFWRIVLPNLKGSLYTIVILSFLNSFKIYREAYLTAGAYPDQSIYLLQHLFNNWFVNLELDKMAAAAVCTGGVLMIAILALQRLWEDS